MKRHVIHLLAAVALTGIASAQLTPGTVTAKAAASDGSNITAPDEFRENIGAGDYFAGVNYLPLAASRVWKDGRLEDQRPPLTVMIAGDSLCDALGNSDLFPEMNFLGWKLYKADRASVTAGTAPLATDGTWFTPDYYSLAASSTVEWVAPSTPTNGVKANRVGVLYYKGASSSEEFTLQYQQNGGAWTDATNNRTGGSTTSGSPNITFTDNGCVPIPGTIVTGTGTGIPASTYVVSATGTTAVLSANCTATEGPTLTFTFAGKIDTSKAASNIAWAEIALSNTGNATKVRVTTAAAKTAKVIGTGAWFGDSENFAGEGGWVLVEGWKGSITPATVAATANSTPTAISTPFAAMQVNLVLNSWFDLPACWDTGGDFDDIKTACDAGLVADWVFLTPSPMNTTGTSVLGTGHTPDADAKLARLAAINWAVRQSQGVIDLYPRWGSWANANRIGTMSNADDYHPTALGKVSKRRICAELFSNELITQRDAFYLGRGPGGRKIYGTAGAYAVKFGAEAQNPLSSLLWYFTGPIQSTDALTAGTTLTVGTTTTLGGALIVTPQALSGAGAVNLTTATTAYTSTGAAQALTLANGTNGQRKTIIHAVDGGSGVLTPTTKTGYTTITFTNAGESVTLEYNTSAGWVIVAINGAVAA